MGDGVDRQDPEPDHEADGHDHDHLKREHPQNGRRRLTDRVPEQWRHRQQNHRRHCELVEQVHLRRAALQPGRAGEQCYARPEEGAAKSQQIPDPCLLASRFGVNAEPQRDSGHREDKTGRLEQGHPLAGNEKVSADGHPYRHDVEEQRNPGHAGVIQSKEEQAELRREEQAVEHPQAQASVGHRKSLAHDERVAQNGHNGTR